VRGSLRIIDKNLQSTGVFLDHQDLSKGKVPLAIQKKATQLQIWGAEKIWLGHLVKAGQFVGL